MSETSLPQSHHEIAMKLAADIVVAYLKEGKLAPQELPGLVKGVCAALLGAADGDDPLLQVPKQSRASPPKLQPQDAVEASAPPGPKPERRISVEESITPDYLICFEDGRPYRSLRRHLMARYGLTPEDYRNKWDLPADYPLVAPSYAQQRSEVAKRIGLGQVKTAEPAPAGQTTRKAAPAKSSAKRRAT
jgi:predicted transcriptional regulator